MPFHGTIQDQVFKADRVEECHISSNIFDQNFDLFEIGFIAEKKSSPDGIGKFLIVAENSQIVDEEGGLEEHKVLELKLRQKVKLWMGINDMQLKYKHFFTAKYCHSPS